MDSPAHWRQEIRAGRWRRPTAGLAPGYAQANLVVVPWDYAYDFLLFCHRNPKPCPLLDVTDPGDPTPRATAPGADLRMDLPAYRVYVDGQMVEERLDLSEIWRPDFVAFLLGCSFTFEGALLRAGVPVRHIEKKTNVAMYITTRPCRPAGVFAGPMVVSMRPIPAALVPRVVQVSARYPLAHGAPVHIGEPDALGIRDLGHPDYGDAVPIDSSEVPVFWACGVTPQAVAQRARLPLMITHAPGHMFLTDLRDEDLALH
ncbi:MAG: putative hydro-lyase [bacterium]